MPSVNTGYGIDYYTGNGSNPAFLGGNALQPLTNASTTGFTHVLYTLAVPIKLTKAVTLTTYVAMNHSEKLRASLNTTQNEIYWGTKLSFAF